MHYAVKQQITVHSRQACLFCQPCWVQIHHFLRQFQYARNKKDHLDKSFNLQVKLQLTPSVSIAKLLSDFRLHVRVSKSASVCMYVRASVGRAHTLVCTFVRPKLECVRMTVSASASASVFVGEKEIGKQQRWCCVKRRKETGGCRQIVSFPQYHH